jgi:hypothetical protein
MSCFEYRVEVLRWRGWGVVALGLVVPRNRGRCQHHRKPVTRQIRVLGSSEPEEYGRIVVNRLGCRLVMNTMRLTYPADCFLSRFSPSASPTTSVAEGEMAQEAEKKRWTPVCSRHYN